MTSLSETSMLAGSSGVTSGYTIDQSIRFNEADNAYMHRTPSGAGNRRTWTWSGWLKHTMQSTSGYHNIWTVRSDNNNFFEIAKQVSTTGDNKYDITNMTSSTRDIRLITNRQFRDTSAWYHLVFVVDTTNDVENERVRFYVNGTRETSFSTETYPSKNLDTFINTTNKHEIGAYNGGSGYMMDGYMADIHFIDGYAYGPEYFGEFKEDTDIWIPKEYTGSYGTNGYKIDGRDSSDLGDDESGNGNDFTTSGLAAHDQVLDSPTNNFCVLNPLDEGSNTTLANGNLEFTSSGDGGVRSSVFFNADKYYIEAIVGTYGNAFSFGIANRDRSLSADAGTDLADFYGWYINPTQNWIASGSNPWNTGSSSASGSLDVLQIAIDRSDTSSIKLYAGINNTYYNSSGGTDGNPSSGSNPTATITGGEEWSIGFWNRDAAASNIFVNFGQEGTFGGNKTAGGNSDANGIGNFFHSVPSGFKALCTRNLGS